MKKIILLIVCFICLFSFYVVNAGNNPPTTTVTIKIMHQTSNGVQWSTGISGYDFLKTPQKAPYGYVSKNNPSIYMDFVIKFGTSQSEASNYAF